MITLDPSWVPEICALPTAEQPLRVAAFSDLFREHLEDVERRSPTALRLTLTAEPATAAAAAELAAQESQCCGFFTFTLIIQPLTLTVDIEVPAPQATVLDALADHARAARS